MPAPIHVTVTGPSFWQIVLAALLGAAVGAAGSIIAGLTATKRQLTGLANQAKLDRLAQRREEALIDLLSLLSQFRVLIRTVIPKHRPEPGELFDTAYWIGARTRMGNLSRAWNESLAFRIATQESRDAFEALSAAWLVADNELKDNPPSEEFWTAVGDLGEAIQALFVLANQTLGTIESA